MPQPLPRDSRPHRRVRSSLRAGFVWSVLAAGINLTIWLIAKAFSVNFQVWPNGQSDESITAGPLVIVAATVFAGTLAGVVVGVAAKMIKKVVRWIIAFGAIITVASLSAPINQPAEVPTSTRIVLMSMHIVTGVVVTLGLARGIWTDDRAVRV